MHHPHGSDRRRELLSAWEERCRARGLDGEASSGPDATFLVRELGGALRLGNETPGLGRAARSWGARFSSPVDALASLSCLREVLSETSGKTNDGSPATPRALHRVIDQIMVESVDSASGNLRAAARTDPLTGCANRRALREDLGRAVAGAHHAGLDVAVAVIDLDGLKKINDAGGHAAGDRALVALVTTMRDALRDADTLYRTGGDEFVVVAPFTNEAGVRELMRRAEQGGGPDFSWGATSLTTTPAANDDPETLLAVADQSLYDQRRIRRKARARNVRRRRATAVGSVAVSVVITSAAAASVAATLSHPSSPAVQVSRLSAAGSVGVTPEEGLPFSLRLHWLEGPSSPSTTAASAAGQSPPPEATVPARPSPSTPADTGHGGVSGIGALTTVDHVVDHVVALESSPSLGWHGPRHAVGGGATGGATSDTSRQSGDGPQSHGRDRQPHR